MHIPPPRIRIRILHFPFPILPSSNPLGKHSNPSPQHGLLATSNPRQCNTRAYKFLWAWLTGWGCWPKGDGVLVGVTALSPSWRGCPGARISLFNRFCDSHSALIISGHKIKVTHTLGARTWHTHTPIPCENACVCPAACFQCLTDFFARTFNIRYMGDDRK